MKFLTCKRFFKIIKRLILLLPMSFLMVTSLYVVINPNAKESYSGNAIYDVQYKFNTNEVETIDDLVVGNIYKYTLSSSYLDNLDDRSVIFYTTYFRWENGTALYDYEVEKNNTTRIMYLEKYSYYVRLLNTNASILLSPVSFTSNTFPISFYFTYVDYASNVLDVANVSISDYLPIIDVEIDTSGSLNNALTYAMSEFNSIGFGKLDFITWFASIFSNNTNNVYIQFANSYFNYVLFVECVAILPMFIHWIIHLFEDAIDYIKIGNKRRKDND